MDRDAEGRSLADCTSIILTKQAESLVHVVGLAIEPAETEWTTLRSQSDGYGGGGLPIWQSLVRGTAEENFNADIEKMHADSRRWKRIEYTIGGVIDCAFSIPNTLAIGFRDKDC